MFEYWSFLPPELRKYIIDWLDVESQLNFACCTLTSFHEVCNCLNSIESIKVYPLPVITVSLSPQYRIQVGLEGGIAFWLIITKRNETTTIVEFGFTQRDEAGWLTLKDGSYEDTITEFLKLLFKKSEESLEVVEISPIGTHSQQKEIDFSSFNIRKQKNLKVIKLDSKNTDFVQVGFITNQQIESATKVIRLTNTEVSMDQIIGARSIDIDQKSLTDRDVLRYLEVLKNSENDLTRFFGMNNLVKNTEPNHINIGIKQRIFEIFEDSYPVFDDALIESHSKAKLEYESEFGRMIYTISILIMFSFVIILLMIRSIKRTHSTVEMDALLDAMRFREELDIRDRQRRRLLKAKTKVTAWLNRAAAQKDNTPPARKEAEWKPPPPRQRHQFSISTMTSDIPAIVVSADDSHISGHRPHTPAISLMYDFAVSNETEEDCRKTSLASSVCLPTSSSSSSVASSIDNRSIKGSQSIRTYSLETNSGATRLAKRVDADDKSFSLDT